MCGANRLVRVRLDPGREADQRARDSGSARAIDFLERVDDDERAELRGRGQLLVRLVVAVDDEPLAGEAGGERELQLPERGDVGADSLLGKKAEELDVRECFRAVRDEGVRSGGAIRASLRA